MNVTSITIIVLSIFPFLVFKLTRKFIYFEIFSLIAIAVHGIYLFGLPILYFLFIIYVVSTIAELASLKTPLNCFGIKYKYSLDHSFFSSKKFILGVYPIEISLAWVLFKYCSFNIALLISKAFLLPSIWVVLLTPLILVSLDLIIDPVAVNISKLWKWEKGSSYFGIPIQNFLGWYAVGFISSLIFFFVDTSTIDAFNFLFILPIIFYAMSLGNLGRLIKIDKTKAIIGSLPGVTWTLAGVFSLLVLYLQTT